MDIQTIKPKNWVIVDDKGNVKYNSFFISESQAWHFVTVELERDIEQFLSEGFNIVEVIIEFKSVN